MNFIKFLLLLIIFNIKISAQSNYDFKSETIDNKEITFSEILQNGPVLVNFWALWCKPCRSEMKHLDAIFLKYKENGLTILGVNQDSPRSLAKVKAFVSSHKINYPVITDPNQEIFQKFNGQSIPLNVLFDKNGNVVFTHIGYLPGDEVALEKEIKTVLEIKQ
ncbi:MAG: TlpA family protein disulfide reductase [Ignavibacteriae bacterium]|jgi:cytochrome c biogenesis protein CcmG, thiol:disulfide interchange protein DsbE|nr:TlpA family protein disulfide reductase [Ignavibacteriota bacterium]